MQARGGHRRSASGDGAPPHRRPRAQGVAARGKRNAPSSSVCGNVPVAEVEQILEGRTEQVQHHDIVVALHGERADAGDAHAAAQDLVQFRLVKQLRVLALDRLELDGHLLARGDVRAEVDVTERAGSNLPPEAVLVGHPNLHGCHRPQQVEREGRPRLFRKRLLQTLHTYNSQFMRTKETATNPSRNGRRRGHFLM